MGNGAAISFGQSLVYSGLGLTVVFLALISLAVMIIIFSRVFSGLTAAASAGESPNHESGAEAARDSVGEDAQTIAAILAAVTEDAAARRETAVVTSINEVK